MGSCLGKHDDEEEKKRLGKMTLPASSAYVPLQNQKALFSKSPYTSLSSAFTIYDKNKDCLMERKRAIDSAIMKEYPIGYSMKGERFQYTMWVPETETTMRHFIEVNHFPMYDLREEKEFKDYCKEFKWENTADQYLEMWNSMRSVGTRVIQAAIIRYDIHIEISDSFISDKGDYSRAYRISGLNQNNVIKAFSFITNSVNPQIGRDIKWHHDSLFAEDIYPEKQRLCDEYDPSKKDCCGNRWDRLDYTTLSRSNTNNNVSDKRLRKAVHRRRLMKG